MSTSYERLQIKCFKCKSVILECYFIRKRADFNLLCQACKVKLSLLNIREKLKELKDYKRRNVYLRKVIKNEFTNEQKRRFYKIIEESEEKRDDDYIFNLEKAFDDFKQLVLENLFLLKENKKSVFKVFYDIKEAIESN